MGGEGRAGRGQFILQDIKAYFKFSANKAVPSWYTSGQKKHTEKHRRRPKYSMDLAHNKGEKRNTLFSKNYWVAT